MSWTLTPALSQGERERVRPMQRLRGRRVFRGILTLMVLAFVLTTATRAFDPVATKTETATTAQDQERKSAASALVQQARVLIEHGKWDEAQQKLKAVIKEYPENRVAQYYLDLIEYKQVTDRSLLAGLKSVQTSPFEWAGRSLVVNGLFHRGSSNEFFAGPSIQGSKLEKALKGIILPEVAFTNIYLDHVLIQLKLEALRLQPKAKSGEFLIRFPVDWPQDSYGVDLKTRSPLLEYQPLRWQPTALVTVAPLKDVSLFDALKAVAAGANPPLTMTIEKFEWSERERATVVIFSNFPLRPESAALKAPTKPSKR